MKCAKKCWVLRHANRWSVEEILASPGWKTLANSGLQRCEHARAWVVDENLQGRTLPATSRNESPMAQNGQAQVFDPCRLRCRAATAAHELAAAVEDHSEVREGGLPATPAHPLSGRLFIGITS